MLDKQKRASTASEVTVACRAAERSGSENCLRKSRWGGGERIESCVLESTEMTQWLVELAIKPDDLSLSPRIHLVERKNQLLEVILCSLALGTCFSQAVAAS